MAQNFELAASREDGYAVPALVAALLATCSFWVVPYMVVIQDQALHIPVILKKLDPSLYAKDFLFAFGSQENKSLYTDLLALLTRVAPLDRVYFMLAWLVRFGACLGMWRLAAGLGKRADLAWGLGAAVLLLAFRNGGTGTDLLDSFVLPRSACTPLMLALLCVWLLSVHERPYWLGGLTGLAFLVHPLTAIPFGVVLFLWYVWRLVSAKSRQDVLFCAARCGGAFVLVTLPLWIKMAMGEGGGPGMLAPFTEKWLSIVRFRNGYLFMQYWKPVAVLTTLFSMLMILRACFLYRNDEVRKKWVWRVVGLTAVVLWLQALSVVFTVVKPFPFLMQLQFIRAVSLIHLCGITLCALAWADALRLPTWPRMGIVFLSCLALVTDQYRTLPIPQEMRLWGMLGANALLFASILWEWRITSREDASSASPFPSWACYIAGAAGLLFPGLLSMQHGVRGLSGLWVVVAGALAILCAGGLCRIALPRVAAWTVALVLAAGSAVVAHSVFCQSFDDSAKRFGVDALSAWAREETKPDALFVFDHAWDGFRSGNMPEMHFRVHAKRSVWFSFKDGAQSIFLPALATQWDARRRLQKYLDTEVMQTDRFQEMLAGEQVDYYVTPRQMPLSLAWEGKGFRVYHIREP